MQTADDGGLISPILLSLDDRGNALSAAAAGIGQAVTGIFQFQDAREGPDQPITGGP